MREGTQAWTSDSLTLSLIHVACLPGGKKSCEINARQRCSRVFPVKFFNEKTEATHLSPTLPTQIFMEKAMHFPTKHFFLLPAKRDNHHEQSSQHVNFGYVNQDEQKEHNQNNWRGNVSSQHVNFGCASQNSKRIKKDKAATCQFCGDQHRNQCFLMKLWTDRFYKKNIQWRANA